MSRDKGKRGEREAARWLRDTFGLEAERNAQQYKGGGAANADVLCPALPCVHFEVKRNEAMQVGTDLLEKAMRQAEKDAGDRMPLVLWRRNRMRWQATMRVHGICATFDAEQLVEAVLMTDEGRL